MIHHKNIYVLYTQKLFVIVPVGKTDDNIDSCLPVDVVKPFGLVFILISFPNKFLTVNSLSIVSNRVCIFVLDLSLSQ